MYSVCTTFNSKQYKEYGKNMVESFEKFWPKNIILFVYFELIPPNSIFPSNKNNVIFIPFNRHCSDQLKFKERNKNRPRIETSFNYQAIRFSYKVFTQINRIKETDSKFVIWMDADTITTKPITIEWLNKLHTDNSHISALLRHWMYTETGFIIFNSNLLKETKFIDTYEKMYTEDNIFKYKAWHDCTAFDETVKQLPELNIYNLSPAGTNMHPFAVGILGERLDHLKGPSRKKLGYSKERTVVHG
jgi:hypothetical protein